MQKQQQEEERRRRRRRRRRRGTSRNPDRNLNLSAEAMILNVDERGKGKWCCWVMLFSIVCITPTVSALMLVRDPEVCLLLQKR
jgi:hypothetical protein